MVNPRCFELFQMACGAKRTRETYTQLLDLFLKWANKDYESLLVLSDIELQTLLEDYMMYCKRRYARSGIRGRFASIEKFLFVNDRIVNKKKLMMFLPEKLKIKQRAITTEEIRTMLAYCGSKRNIAIVHVFSATGCRPEALADLRIEKFWVLLGISIVVGWGISMPIDMIIPYPYAYLVSFSVSIAISVYVVRYFARKYNEKIVE